MHGTMCKRVPGGYITLYIFSSPLQANILPDVRKLTRNKGGERGIKSTSCMLFGSWLCLDVAYNEALVGLNITLEFCDSFVTTDPQLFCDGRNKSLVMGDDDNASVPL